MGGSWSKIAVIVILVITAVVAGRWYLSRRGQQADRPERKDFYDVIEEDDSRLRAEPNFEDVERAEQRRAAERTEQPVQEVEEAAEAEPKPQPIPKFTELSEAERIEAERLFEFAMQQRKIGRLPVTGYKPMVDACRQLIRRFSGSEFDYKARRMLADIPDRYRQRYNITKEEVDLTGFFK